MATVVLHPGIGKAGSSSIQAWLGHDIEQLRASGAEVLVAPPDREGGEAPGIELKPYESGPVNANDVTKAWDAEDDEKRALFESLFEQIEAQAGRSQVTIVSAEAMAVFFWRVDEEFLQELEALGRRHEVRVAYYVRPQHSSLEAGWRQWGFRSTASPSQFIAEHAKSHHYFETYEAVRRLAPSVRFEPRPFRRDLLDLGDPAADFAGRFLGMSGPSSGGPPIWANRGLGLEVVNALRPAVRGRFWSSMHDNRLIDRFKDFLGDLDAPESERVVRSRLVLQAYAHQTFAAGNARLVEAMGWSAEHFVPPPPDGAGDAGDLTLLDELWQPLASEAELETLYLALEQTASEGSGAPPGSAPPSERALAEAKSALAAATRDLAGARRELARAGSSRSWRVARGLARASSFIRRDGSSRRDPLAAVSKHVERAAHRTTAVELDTESREDARAQAGEPRLLA